MKVTSLNNPQKLLTELEQSLLPLGIILYDISLPTNSSIKFRAKRTYNKSYVAGGMKYGNPVHVGSFTPAPRLAKHLHYEEWACINDLINDICNTYQLNGTCRSYFDQNCTYIRKNGDTLWSSELDKDDIDTLILCAQNHTSKAS